MPVSKPDRIEPRHLQVLQCLAYASALLLYVQWVATFTAAIAASVGVVCACLLHATLAARRVRWQIMAAGGGFAILLGIVIPACLAGSPALVSACGLPFTVSAYFSLQYGLLAFGGVFGLRALVRRWPTLAVLEAALLVLLVTLPFASHRNYRLSEPRELADWAFAHGYEPGAILCGIGLATLLAVAVLRFRNLCGRQTAASLAALLLCALLGFPLRDKLPAASSDAPFGGQQSASGSSKSDSDRPPQGDHPSQADRQPLAVVTLHDDVSAGEFGFYLRAEALSKLDHSRLSQSTDPAIDADVPSEFPAQPTRLNKAPAGSANNVVSTTVSLISGIKRPICLVNAELLEPRENADPNLFLRTYHVSSRVGPPANIELFKKKAGNPAWSAATQAHYLACPQDPRYAELAAKILAESFDAQKIGIPECRQSPMLHAYALRRWIETNCTYSLQLPSATSLDSVAAFLFGDRRGSCTHVAQSLTILLRSRGIPARTAGGYMVPMQRRGQGSALLVMKSDGHAWCEIYLEGVGWVTVDAALEKSEEPRTPDPDPAAQAFFGERNRVDNPLRDQRSFHLMRTAYIATGLAIALARPGHVRDQSLAAAGASLGSRRPVVSALLSLGPGQPGRRRDQPSVWRNARRVCPPSWPARAGVRGAQRGTCPPMAFRTADFRPQGLAQTASRRNQPAGDRNAALAAGAGVVESGELAVGPVDSWLWQRNGAWWGRLYQRVRSCRKSSRTRKLDR